MRVARLITSLFLVCLGYSGATWKALADDIPLDPGEDGADAEQGQGGLCDSCGFPPDCQITATPGARVPLVRYTTQCTLSAANSEFQYTWVKTTGPGGATLESPRKARTQVTFQQPGTYQFKLTVNYGADRCWCVPTNSCGVFVQVFSDCNANGREDSGDIGVGGGSLDANANGIPDECETFYRRADANDDGFVDISDAIFTLGYLFSGETSSCPSALDANRDAEIDISDAIAVLQFLFSGTGSIPGPFPDCGLDLGSAFECGGFDSCAGT